MDKRTAAADLRARNQALLKRARVALEAFVLVRARVSHSLVRSRSLLAELGTRDIVKEGPARLRRRY